MKITGKICMWISAIIIIAHTIIPHQHKGQLKSIIHTCLLSDPEEISDSSNIFKKLEDVVKHVNLGEKHLENFRISNYEYEVSISHIFDVPIILAIKKFIYVSHSHSHKFHYCFSYKTIMKELSNGLRAPPRCI